MGKVKKTLLIIGGSLLLLVILVIVFISPLTKYLIEKYDVEYTGREITLDWAYINPFTGYIHFDDLKIYEHESEDVFFATKGLSVNLSMFKLISGNYEISSVTLNKPLAYIIQHELRYNFEDLIEKFASEEDKVEEPKETVKFSVLDIKIKDGEFHYEEDQTPVNYFIKNVNVESDGLRYDIDTISIKYSFESGTGSGKIAGEFMTNLDNQDYRLAVKIDSFDLEIINQYIKDLTNYGTFAAMLDAELRSSGNFGAADSMTSTGKIAITDFNFGRTRSDDFLSFKQLVIDIVELSPGRFVYHYDSISLDSPYFRYELYDSLDNIQTMFGVGGENVSAVDANSDKFNLVIEIAKLIEQISQNLLRSPYKIGRLAVYNGDIQYSDFSLGEKFNIELKPFTILADSVDKSKDRVKILVKSGIVPHGNFFVALSANPQDTTFFDMEYKFEKIALSMFNPYLKTFTSFPLDRGSLEFFGKWDVEGGQIKSTNNLILVDPRTADRVKNKDTKYLPVPLAFAFIRERGNVIDYEIPITGNLNDPNFNFWDVITDLIKNIFIKPVTIPYRMEVRNIEQQLEKSLSMQWDMESVELNSNQEKFIDRIVKFLKKNEEANVVVAPKNYAVKEKEFILLYEAKKKYFIQKNQLKGNKLSYDDSVTVSKMSIKDPGFVSFLDAQIKDETLFTVQHKAAKIIETSIVNSKFEQLNKARQRAFMTSFKDKGVDKQVTFVNGENVYPFNGFSFYNITYKGEMPEYLNEAYNQMIELNNKDPRSEYQKFRDKISLF